MLCYHIAHLLPGLCLHDCWFLFYWPIVGRRMFEGKRRILGGIYFSWCMSLVMQTEGRLWGLRNAFSSHSVFVFVAFYIDSHNQHHTLFLVNPGMPACIFGEKKKLFHGFDVSYCWLSSDVCSCFILCCFPFVFSKVRQSWVVLIWYFTCQVVVTFFSVLFNCCKLSFWQ